MTIFQWISPTRLIPVSVINVLKGREVFFGLKSAKNLLIIQTVKTVFLKGYNVLTFHVIALKNSLDIFFPQDLKLKTYSANTTKTV